MSKQSVRPATGPQSSSRQAAADLINQALKKSDVIRDQRLDYYEAGQPLSVHLRLRSRGWAKAWVILPHDGAHGDKVFATSYESAIREAQFHVLVIPKGAGPAKARIETARRHFPRIFFNVDTTEGGRDAVGWYHEKKSNDDRNIGLGPNHDWSSHGADNFGLMCIHYDQPDGAPPRPERYRSRRNSNGGGGSWQRVKCRGT